MKFSYNWIRELVDGLDLTPLDLERLITMKTAECEGIQEVGRLLDGACVARVDVVEPIPGGHNVKAEVETGWYGRKTVVCGAPNCRSGLFSVYAPVGMRTIQGVESDGMLVSAAELEISDDAAGIIELDSRQVGVSIPGCVPDNIIEIDNKSITHRPDLWGHVGMAREVAAIARKLLRDPVDISLLPQGPPAVGVSIEDLTLCPRYSALVFENITVQPSPPWLQYRLRSIGLNPINNIVDFTNYLMAELAQPMHAFDRRLLKGETIFIRPARSGERVVLLNEQEYQLTESDLVIADEKGPVALAGVMGAYDTGIGDTTTSIVLESANFQASSIRKTSSSQKLRTDASMRFEKAQDPANTVRALARAIELLKELSPGARLVGGVADQSAETLPPPPIELPLDWMQMKLGCKVDSGEVRDILERLAFGVTEVSPRVFSVSVPSWRATKDVSVKEDLVEEIGRMVGYDTIEPVAPPISATVPPDHPGRKFHRAVRALLAAQGYTEVHNYSFVSEEEALAFGFDPAEHVGVTNPIAAGQELLRKSLLPGIRRNILSNSRHSDSFRLFEIGREIHKQPGAALPREVTHLVAAIYAKDSDGSAGLFALKHAAESLMPGCEVRFTEALPFEHPARSAEILWRGAVLGRLFELHPSMVEGRGAILDINLAKVQELAPRDKAYTPIRRYPSSSFDLSVITPMRQVAGDLEKKLRSFAGPMLEKIVFLRVYSGPPLAEGSKSVSYRLTLGSSERTLSSEEVAQIRAGIIEGMHGLGYELRL